MTSADEQSGVGGEQDFWFAQLACASAYNKWVASRVLPYIRGTVVEVGCGVGNYTCMLASCADRVIGFDIDAEYIELAKHATEKLDNVEVRCADVFDVSIEHRADAVVMLDVLEHIEDDVAALIRLRELLVPGGRVILKVPAVAAIYNGMDRAIGHYRRYSRSGLCRVLDAAGFADIRLRAFNMPGIFGWWLNGSVLGRSIPPAEQIGGFNGVVPVIRALERLIPPPVGLSLIAVASKPEQR